MGTSAAPVRAAAAIDDEPDPTEPRGHDDSREWGISPLEPLSIRTANFESVHLADLPMSAHADPLDATLDLGIADHEHAMGRFAPAPGDDSEDLVHSGNETEPVPRPVEPAPTRTAEPWSTRAAERAAEPAPAAPKAQVANESETQRIVSIRVCATGETRWSGLDLMAALENHGLAHGRYNVFHRKHSDGRTLFCAASLVEPGVFNLAKMPQQEFRGLTLFAVLPGPLEPLQTLDAVVETAGELAAALHGTLQDSHGAPLTMQRAEALREDVARFQALLTMT